MEENGAIASYSYSSELLNQKSEILNVCSHKKPGSLANRM